MELDGYCKELDLAFERHGEQHYLRDTYFNRLEEGRFEKQLQRDRLKIELCEAAGIRLVVVPCFVKDLWTFTRLYLLRWFTMAELLPVMLNPLSKDS